jgi:hypothetical protein
MHLKAPPERVELIADAIERDIDANDDYLDIKKLQEILTWLRYRLAKWAASHPATPAE